jgi:hypothetical protein
VCCVSGVADARIMEATGVERSELDHLVEEIARYLAVVDELRAVGREPTWWPEPVAVREPYEPRVSGVFGSCRTRRWL